MFSRVYQFKPRHRGLGEERTSFYVLSEGRKIESRCQLEKTWPSHKRSKRKGKRIGHDTRTQARERPHRHAGGRSRNGLDLKLLIGTKKRLDTKDVD